VDAADLLMITGYFVAVLGIGFWVSRRVQSESDYFLGGRRFGKGLLVMHWLCTGTHSEMAVQVAGAAARVGLGGIWYQWMWLFSTPFYWLVAPVHRRMRVTTTGDFFRIRYGRTLELLYSVVGLTYLALSIALLLRGAGAAIAGATGGQVPTHLGVVALSLLFSTYVMAGGLVSAAYTDLFQGLLIVVLSLLLVPAILARLGGLRGLHERLPAAMFGVTAPAGASEADPAFVVAMSLLGLVGVVVQPHVMTATASGKTELEARVGMVGGNFIKRLLTMAWVFSGLIAAVQLPEVLAGLDRDSAAARQASEMLFGRSIREFLGGLARADDRLPAGITSAETFMVTGSALFTRNLYVPLRPGRGDRHYLWVGRAAAAALLGLGITLALRADSVTHLVVQSVQVIGLLGPAFWLGIVWRRVTAAGVWVSFLAGVAFWVATAADAASLDGIPGVGTAVRGLVMLGDCTGLRQLSRPAQLLLGLAVQFGLMVAASLVTRPHDSAQLNGFFARLLTPVGSEVASSRTAGRSGVSDGSVSADSADFDAVSLDYDRAAPYGYRRLQRYGIEIPRLSPVDWGGFVAAWLLVALLIGLLLVLARWQ
jgi:Na+/proline symporter